MRFRDRREAGRQLAEVVGRADLGGGDAVVLGLPRGGVPVAFEVARALDAPLDVIVVRKLGVPFQPELAMGAIGEGGVLVVNQEVRQASALEAIDIDIVASPRARPSWTDGRGSTGADAPNSTSRGAVPSSSTTGSPPVRPCEPPARWRGRSVPLASSSRRPSPRDRRWRRCRDVSDEIVCVEVPEPFYAVGEWYRDFSQTSDDEVVELLRSTAGALRDGERTFRVEILHCETRKHWCLPVGSSLSGRVTVPVAPLGTVVFAHGSGSSRHSPRNRYVARVLNEAGLATLLVDLLSRQEESDRSYVFDIGLLADRLGDAMTWTRTLPELASAKIGLFGASTGAAAALRAAAQPESGVSAVVSRGGRPDLAAPWLGAVTAPTLLIVGSCDETVVELNRRALDELRCESQLTLVPGATHLFEEPGALELVADLARDWFVAKLASA